MTLINCAISGNWSTAGGGGIFTHGEMTLIDCTISGNWSGGISSDGNLALVNCTISGNAGGGISFCASADSSLNLTNCIVWDNIGGSMQVDCGINIDGQHPPRVSYSCIEQDEVWPGEGNINDDPLFCGWDSGELSVDDQRGLVDALSFDFALSGGSPCLGSGKGGVNNMGADRGVCDLPGERERLVHVGPGNYSIEGLHLSHRVSIEGSGQEETIIEGMVLGQRTGAVLSHLTVTGGAVAGIVVHRGESPKVSSCTIVRSGLQGDPWWGASGGVICEVDSSPTIENCEITDNETGVYCRGASPVLTNCTISGNSGGGVRC